MDVLSHADAAAPAWLSATALQQSAEALVHSVHSSIQSTIQGADSPSDLALAAHGFLSQASAWALASPAFPLISGAHALFVARRVRSVVELSWKNSINTNSNNVNAVNSGRSAVPWVLHLLLSVLATVAGGTLAHVLSGKAPAWFSGKEDYVLLQIVFAWWLINHAPLGIASLARWLLSLRLVFVPLAALEAINRTRSILAGFALSQGSYPGAFVAALVITFIAGTGGSLAMNFLQRQLLPTGLNYGQPPLSELSKPAFTLQSGFFAAAALILLSGNEAAGILPWGALVSRAEIAAGILALLVMQAVTSALAGGPVAILPLSWCATVLRAVAGIDDLKPPAAQPAGTAAVSKKAKKVTENTSAAMPSTASNGISTATQPGSSSKSKKKKNKKNKTKQQ